MDASALLAYFHGEAGSEVVAERLQRGAVMSAVNWAETLSKLEDKGSIALQAAFKFRAGMGDAFTVASFSESDAEQVAALRNATRPHGLSLGDRACLALAAVRETDAVTADRAWKSLFLDIDVQLIR